MLAQLSRVAAVAQVEAGLQDRLHLAGPGIVGMILPEVLAALEQVIQTRLVQSVVAAIRRPPVAHEHAGVVGPQHRGGVVEPAAGADRVDRRVRGGEYPQPVAFAADAPAGLVRRDHGRVANLLAQLRVGRRGGAGGPVQHVGETARRDLQAERGPQQVRHLRQRHPQLRVQLDDQRNDSGTELHARRAQRVGGLQNVAALHPPLTLRAVADLDVEAPYDRAHHGQFFLILRRHARHLDRAAAVRTRRRCRRRVVLVDLGRARTGRLPPVGRAGPPAGMPAAPLGSVLGEGGRLPESGSARGRQLLLEVVGLPLQAVVLTPQAFVAALQAFVLVSQARAVALAPRPLSAPPFLFRAWLPFLTAIPSALVGHTRVMPYCEKLYKYKIVVFLIAQQRDLAKRIPSFIGSSRERIVRVHQRSRNWPAQYGDT